MRQFIHFAPGETLPQAGDTISIHSEMTGMDYETTIQRIISTTPLDNGMTRLTIDGIRREVPPPNVIAFPESVAPPLIYARTSEGLDALRALLHEALYPEKEEADREHL